MNWFFEKLGAEQDCIFFWIEGCQTDLGVTWQVLRLKYISLFVCIENFSNPFDNALVIEISL